ncbi:hypothetical protein VZC37_18510 [Gordonia sp. LSe1-13]|uniref:Mce-associated membrane protein n=1 Tax=Gordonia sesuvii TaxID=3116777 RepID=A0ABU7MGV4_9ACTN|nr:hypothetical protein [Gordonia sp. LSe1-13]
MPKSQRSAPPDERPARDVPAPDEVTSLDGERFLEVNRSTRDRLRAEADRPGWLRRRRGRRPSIVDDDESRDDAPDRGGRRRPRVLVLALGVLVVLLAASTAFFATKWMQAEDRAEEAGPSQAERSEVMDVAREYAAVIATYDPARYDDLDRRIREISTSEFANTYITSSQDARRGNASVRGVSRAVSNDAGVQSLSDDEAVVLVTLDQTVTSPEVNAELPEGIPYQSRVKVTLERQDGRWLLAGLDTV